MQLAEGTVVADRFRLVRELGQGGMGSVWFAHHTGLDIPCAVKFIHADVASLPEIRARFEREAKAAAQLRSPNVVQVLDYGVSEGIPYIAMEFLEGEDLAHRIKRMQRLSPHETSSIIGQVARALVKAHAAGLVHRDLKPENIFLVRDDDREIAKVLDFGIAKTQAPVAGDSATKTGSLLGTPHYMSPEQAQGTKAVDFRSDLWALAVITYRCMTGRLPFESEALGDLLVKIIVNPIPVPSQIAPGLPRTFDAWWTRAAARDPAQRFQSAKELADSLSVALGISASMSAPSAQAASFPPAPHAGATIAGAPQSAAMHTPPQGGYGAGYAPAGPTVPEPPGYASQPGYAPAGPTALSGATSHSGYTPMPVHGPGTHAPTALGSQMSPSYPGLASASQPGVAGVPHTTNPAVSHTFTGQPQPVAPSGNGKLIAVVVAGGLLLGGVGAVFALRSSPKTDAHTASAASIAPSAPVADVAPTPVPTIDTPPPAPPTAAATAAATSAPVAPAKTAAKPPPAPPPTHRPPVVVAPPPPPANTRTGKVVLPGAPPAGKGKDFGF